jgi:hypothetical protein
MRVSKLIEEKLLNDTEFRLKTALAIGVTERSIKNYVKDHSDNLTKYAAVLIYQSHGFSIEQIFEPVAA